MDYTNGKIYKLQCDDGHFYIGSTTTELRKRFCSHKGKSAKHPERRVYKHIKSVGWDAVRIVLIEDFPCDTREQLTRHEDVFVGAELFNPFCLNSNRAFRTDEELKEYNSIYYAEHRDERAAYYADHRDEKVAYQAAYDAANRDAINARQASYRVANRDTINAYQASYRVANRAAINARRKELRANRKLQSNLLV